MITSFAIFKAEKKSEKSPDYTISAKIGEKYVTIGGAWIKDGTKGKFFSCQLSKPYNEKAGYHVEIDVPEAPKTTTSVQPDGSDPIDVREIPF